MAKSPLLDFRKFKHVSSDDKTTTLRHKDGHLLKIARAALSKDMQAQLKAMAEGGEVQNKTPMPAQKAQSTQPQSETHDIPPNVNGPVSMDDAIDRIKHAWAEGGKVPAKEATLDYNKTREEKRRLNRDEASRPVMPKKKYADGGETSLMSTNQMAPFQSENQHGYLPCLNTQCKSYGKSHPNCRCWGNKEMFMAKGGEVVHYCRTGWQHEPSCEYHKGGSVEQQESEYGISQQGRDVRHGHKAKSEGHSEDREIAQDFAREEAKGRAEEERHIKPKLKGLADGGDPEEAPEIKPEPRWYPDDKPDGSPGFYGPGPRPKHDADFEPIEDTEPVTETRPQPAMDKTETEPEEIDRELKAVTPDEQSGPPMTQDPSVTAQAGLMNQTANSGTDMDQDRKTEAAQMVHDANQFGMDNYAGHIQPKTYHDIMYKDRSLPGKLASLFGVIVGGIGSGLTGQPNAALHMMDKLIDRDIDAQKQDVHNRQNAWNLAYSHLLQEAQSRGADTSSQLVQAQTAEKANAYTRMLKNQGFLGQMAAQIDRMPEGPTKEAQKKALFFVAQQSDAQNSTLAGKWASQSLLYDKTHRPNQLPENRTPQPGQALPAPGGAPSQGKTKGNAGGDWKGSEGAVYHILNKGAQGKFNDIMNDLDPMWSKSKDDIKQQFTQAQQIEKALNGPKGTGEGGIHDLMQQMHAAQGHMGLYGHLHGKATDALGALPFVGDAAAAIPAVLPDTHSEKRFNALRTTLETDLGTALQGLMTPTDIHHAVSKFAPAYQDTPDDVKFKEQQLVNIIKKAMRGSVLSGPGLLQD